VTRYGRRPPGPAGTRRSTEPSSFSPARNATQCAPGHPRLSHAAATAEHGWALGDPYRDVRSASRYANGNGRPRFERLLADLERGRFGAGVLVLW
jgi:site-specific DNA recombinase